MQSVEFGVVWVLGGPEVTDNVTIR